MGSLQDTKAKITLQNHTSSQQVYGYITGSAINKNDALFLLESDGKTYYYPSSPSSPTQPLQRDVAIPLGAPGHSVEVEIPFLEGGRIWFSVGERLKFLLNPGSHGASLVEPSVANPSDPNINITWGFCEFTFNSAQLFVNISFIDFVSIPISLTLTQNSGPTQYVPGMPADGLDKVCDGLRKQTEKDGHPWSSLIKASPDGKSVIRAVGPNLAIDGNPKLFSDYWDKYVDQVWQKYTQASLTIDTQTSLGDLKGKVQEGTLEFPGGASFHKPTSADIFNCSTGPFTTGSSPEVNAIVPRVAAAFNRSTLLSSTDQPNGASVKDYYQTDITNHFSRIVHAATVDGKGYAFPYDDVTPNGGKDQAGVVQSGNPKVLTVTVGAELKQLSQEL